MDTLPVRAMVLYKHGVGFYLRAGRVEGESVALTFLRDEINDVLKSLAVFDGSGQAVRGIHYHTPMTAQERLDKSSIRLSDLNSLRDLLRDLRGRQAALQFETTPGTVKTVTGRVVGVDVRGGLRPESFDPAQVDEVPEMSRVVVLAEDGQVRVFRFDDLRSVTVQDEQATRDLSYFLDISMSEDERRAVTVRLGAGEHDLTVYYVAPSPTWRVSYRFVGESEDSGAGRGILQGWGLFDNRLEEDLQDVQVTLVAGQPISFIYELYASRIPERPLVEDEARIAPGPLEFDAATARVGGMLTTASLEANEEVLRPPAVFGMLAGAPAAAPTQRVASKLTRDALAEARLETAETRDTGETFQYAVKTPVSVRRGESALVPILSADVAYERELLYNGEKLPKHPVAALRFKNASGLTLERGPVTVVEDGDYKGEAVVPFSKQDGEVYLPYAVELGVRVKETVKNEQVMAGLHIEGAFMVFEEYHAISRHYTLENTTRRDLTITVEAALLDNYELYNSAAPDVETLGEKRWRVKVKAGSKADFTWRQRQRIRRQSGLRGLAYRDLEKYLKDRWLDQETFDRLALLLDTLAYIQKSQKRRTEVLAGREDLYKKQENLRANIEVLQPEGKEADLRDRLLGQLEAAQDQLDDIDDAVAALDDQIVEAEDRVEAIIAALNEPA